MMLASRNDGRISFRRASIVRPVATYRTICRTWVLFCALVLMPWAQAAASQMDMLPAFCNTGMWDGTHSSDILTGVPKDQLQRIFCQSVCANLGAVSASHNIQKAAQTPLLVVSVLSVIFTPKSMPVLRKLSAQQAQVTRPPSPPFLALRLLI